MVLELLVKDLGLIEGYGLTIISDQHKGLLEAVKEVLPYAEHRQCARHIYANFRKSYNGDVFKNLFWKAAGCTIEGAFKDVMEEIKAVDVGAYQYLMDHHPETWCRAFFHTGRACESFENGMSESFNAMIIKARFKPLITMLEMIRIGVMERLLKQVKEQESWDGPICPNILLKLEEFGKYVRFWAVFSSGGGVYETRLGYESYKVDLQARYCTCRRWEISGIPCVHAIAAINEVHENSEDYISPWFSLEKYQATYSSFILPVNGSNLWPITPYIPPLPPIARRMPGRPKVKRRRHASETEKKYPTVSKAGKTVKCTNCQQYGHNKSSCKNAKEPEMKEKKKRGRPSLEEALQKKRDGKRKTQSDQPMPETTEPRTKRDGRTKTQSRQPIPKLNESKIQLALEIKQAKDLRESGYSPKEIEEALKKNFHAPVEMEEVEIPVSMDGPNVDLTQEFETGLTDVPINEAEDGGDEEGLEETHVQFMNLPKLRKKSERIVLQKMKKSIGGKGSSQKEPLHLD